MKLLKENPSIGNISKKKRIKKPNCPSAKYVRASLSGKIRAKILDPSSGGIGNKLKIAKSKLRSIILLRRTNNNVAKNAGSAVAIVGM